MNKVLRCIRVVFIATINICLLCGAGDVLDWFIYLSKKTTGAGKKIKQLALKTVAKRIPAPIKRSYKQHDTAA